MGITQATIATEQAIKTLRNGMIVPATAEWSLAKLSDLDIEQVIDDAELLIKIARRIQIRRSAAKSVKGV